MGYTGKRAAIAGRNGRSQVSQLGGRGGNKGRDVFVVIVVILRRRGDRRGSLWGNLIIGQRYQKWRGGS